MDRSKVLKRTTPAKTPFSRCLCKTLGCSPCRVVAFWWALGGGRCEGFSISCGPPTAFPAAPENTKRFGPTRFCVVPFRGEGERARAKSLTSVFRKRAGRFSDVFWGAVVGVFVASPTALPSAPKSTKKFRPSRFYVVLLRGEGEGAWAKSLSSVFRGSIPRSVFSAPGVTRGDLVVDPGGHSSGRPNRARVLDLPPFLPPKSTN